MPNTKKPGSRPTPKDMPSTPKDLYAQAKAKVMSLGNMLGLVPDAPQPKARTTDIELPSTPMPSTSTAETFRVGDLGLNVGGGSRYNSVTNAMDSPFNKGLGYFGPLAIARSSGAGSMSELSATSDLNGTRMDYPLLVPTLTKAQVLWLLQNGEENIQIPRDIEQAARKHAQQRINMGKSPFATLKEQNLRQFPEIKRQSQPTPMIDTRTFTQTPTLPTPAPR